MTTLKTAEFIEHLRSNDHKVTLQLICNDTSCQWMTDSDQGATWLETFYRTPDAAIRQMRRIMAAVRKETLKNASAYSARVIF